LVVRRQRVKWAFQPRLFKPTGLSLFQLEISSSLGLPWQVPPPSCRGVTSPTEMLTKRQVSDVITPFLGFMKYNLNIILVAARSKAWVCSLSLAGIVGSNPAGGRNVCLL
jgi:hypothetical protein